jgi:O-antigen ligase/polysaccharide polymerase Wzy-like membrane protein
MTAAALSLAPARGRQLPGVASTGLILFLWLLPFHSLIIALLFGVVGLPEGTVRMIAAWKEFTIAALLLWVAGRALLGRGPASPIAGTDVALAALFGIALLSLFTANPLFRADMPPGALLYGFRDAVFFMGLYYVGRASPEIAESDRVLRHAYLIALVVSVIGIVERVFVSPDMLVLFGVAAYMNDFLGMSAYTVGNEWGLPHNYWSTLGGVEVRRAGSVFLHSQGFALPFLLLMPAATIWALNRRGNHAVLVRAGYALIWLGLLLSLTRFTIMICALQVALYFVLFRKPEWAVGSAVAGVGIVALAVVLVPGLLAFIWETLTWQTGSSESHLKDWSSGLVAFLEQPWGHGLGTTDAVAIRFLREPLTADNMYLSYAVQLGIAGLIAFLAMFAGIITNSLKVFRSAVAGEQRRFAAVVALTTLGILINGITSIVFSSLMLAYLYFFFAGAVVTVAQRGPPR